MAEQTAISWADSTANFWIGCQKVSGACDNCYAEELMDTRYGRVQWGPHADRLYCKQGWADVARWQRAAAANENRDPQLGRRRRIFVNSLSDFFDNHRSVVWRDEAWDLIRRSPGLIFMLVTKRPQNIAAMLPPFWDEIAERVWVLTTTENQEEAERRITPLVCTFRDRARPAVLGLSAEPLLGPIDLASIVWAEDLDWVIVGGESGKNARPMHPRWVRQLRDWCATAGVAFHFKQWGEWAPAIGTREGDVIFQDPHPDFPGNEAVKIGTTVRRIGKTKAGHQLCGREHLAFPEAA